MNDLTPEKLAELRRLLDAATPVPLAQGDPAFGGRNAQCVVSISSEAMGRDVMGPMLRPALFDVELIVAAVNALPALLDAAAERDRLAATVERVRALPVGPPSGGYYMVSMRDVRDAIDALDDVGE